MVFGRSDSWRRDTRPGALVILFGLALAGFAALWAFLVLSPKLVAIDHAASGWVRSFASPTLDSIAIVFTTLGGFSIMSVLTVAVVAWFLWRNLRAEALLLGLTIPLGSLLGEGVKIVIGRSRPALEYARIPMPHSLAFPSGHALTSFLFFGTLVFLLLTVDEGLKLRTKVLISAFCCFMILAISLSRVFLGVHYLGDIVGGWLLGGAFMTLTTGLYIFGTSGRTSD